MTPRTKMKQLRCFVKNTGHQLSSFRNSRIATFASSVSLPQASCFTSIKATSKKWRTLRGLETWQQRLWLLMFKILPLLDHGKQGSDKASWKSEISSTNTSINSSNYLVTNSKMLNTQAISWNLEEKIRSCSIWLKICRRSIWRFSESLVTSLTRMHIKESSTLTTSSLTWKVLRGRSRTKMFISKINPRSSKMHLIKLSLSRV